MCHRLLGADGRTEARIDGFIPPAPLVSELRRIKSGNGTVSDFRSRLATAPDDLSLVSALADKLAAVGQGKEAARFRDPVRRQDPGGRTTTGARLAIQDAIANVIEEADGSTPSGAQLQRLAQVIDSVENERARFEGQSRLADFLVAAGDEVGAHAVWAAAWGRIPAGLVLDWGNDLTFLLVQRLGQLDDAGRALMLEAAESLAARAEARLEPEGSSDP